MAERDVKNEDRREKREGRQRVERDYVHINERDSGQTRETRGMRGTTDRRERRERVERDEGREGRLTCERDEREATNTRGQERARRGPQRARWMRGKVRTKINMRDERDNIRIR